MNNNVMHEMSVRVPVTMQELADIPGFGLSKAIIINTFISLLLRIILQRRDDTDFSSDG